MKNATKFGLTALACLMLAACGSSSHTGDISATALSENNARTQKKALSQNMVNKNEKVLTTKDKNNLAKDSKEMTITSSANNDEAQINHVSSTLVNKADDNLAKDTKETTTTSSINNDKANSFSPILDKKTGNILVIKAQDENVNVNYIPQTYSSIMEIRVDGKTVPTYSGDLGEWDGIGPLEICCSKYSYIRFGIAYDGAIIDQDFDFFVFYNGNTTKEMPNYGTASYNGDLILLSADRNQAFNGDKWKAGKSAFQVDFGSKQLTGNFNVEGLAPITVKAKIEGNGFNGQATSDDFSKAADLEGKFYGPKAQELGGLFEEKATRSWGGAFGAKQ